jgi:hypothetical protein
LAGTSLFGNIEERSNTLVATEEVPMAKYRLPELDLSTRMEMALEMLQSHPKREWGRVTELAEQHNISRTRLYELRDSAHEALVEALRPRRPGPRPELATVEVNETLIKRMITGFPMLTGSVRDIQLGLDLFVGVQRSIGVH